MPPESSTASHALPGATTGAASCAVVFGARVGRCQALRRRRGVGPGWLRQAPPCVPWKSRLRDAFDHVYWSAGVAAGRTGVFYEARRVMRARRGTWPPEARKVGLPPCLALPCGYLAADRASHVYTRAARVTVLRLSARRGVLVPLDSEGCSRNRRARSVLRGPDHRQVGGFSSEGPHVAVSCVASRLDRGRAERQLVCVVRVRCPSMHVWRVCTRDSSCVE